jgi:signal transduction histidine kinase/ActR/RegA family two-component response regulator
MSYNKLLKKQIARHLPKDYQDAKELCEFLEAISDNYDSFDRDKKIIENAFIVSEREFNDVVASLKNQNEIRLKSISELKNVISAIDAGLLNGITDSDNDILQIITLLKEQIRKTKELEKYLTEAKEIAEKTARAKSDFLSTMSHEIRTPLNAIIGYIHLLKQENPMPSQVEYLDILQISSKNLLSLVNDILDFNKIEENKIIFASSDIEIRKLLNEIKMANKIMADERGNTIRIMVDEDIPKYLVGDTTRLAQVFNNLVSNAIKFTTNGRITVELQLKAQEGNNFIIDFSISDTGIGINEESQKHIFHRFTQAHKYITREYGGTGLGLAIIQKLLKLMGSEIRVKSKIGEGSTFYFTLTLPKSSLQEGIEIDMGSEKLLLDGVRVLLVEDITYNAMLAKKMLTNWNAQVTIADNGLKAVEKVKMNEFDIVLMDVQMPVMDGITATKEIRKFNQEINIFPLTAAVDAEIQAEFAELGANEFILKPINPDSLRKTLLKWYSSRGVKN